MLDWKSWRRLNTTSRRSFFDRGNRSHASLYSESVEPCIPAYRAASDLLRRPTAGLSSCSPKDKAAFRHCAPQSRPTIMVRSKKETRPAPSPSTFSLIIPNAFTGLRARTIDPQHINCARYKNLNIGAGHC